MSTSTCGFLLVISLEEGNWCRLLPPARLLVDFVFELLLGTGGAAAGTGLLAVAVVCGLLVVVEGRGVKFEAVVGVLVSSELLTTWGLGCAFNLGFYFMIF